MAVETHSDMLITDHEALNNIPGGVAVFSYHNGEVRILFANNGFYDIHHGSKAYWMSKSPNPIDWLVTEDQNFFWKELHNVQKGIQTLGNAAYRITGEDGATHWVNNQFRFAYCTDGVEYYYASFTGLDMLKAAEQSRAEARKMYEAAVEDAKLVVWEYFIKEHRIVMAENEFTQYDYRKFNLPKIINNVPQSLLSYIDDAYTELFLDMYRKIDSGEPKVSGDVWYKFKSGTEPRCEHISYTTVFDDDGKPVKAYGIGQNITRQRLDQEEYNRMREQIAGNLQDVVSSTQLNISKNLYISGYSPYPNVVKSLERQTADEHFLATTETVVNEEIKKGIIQDFTCENLLRLFKSGQKQIEREYPVRTSYGGIMWIHAIVHMVQNPNTGDIEGITYAKNITKQKRNGEIITKLTNAGSDYIGVIDRIDSSFEMHTQNWKCGAMKNGQRLPYEQVRGMLADRYIAEDNRTFFMKATELDKVYSSLKEKEQYIVAFDFYSHNAADDLFKKQIVFSWLNDEHREALCIQQDVTEAYQKEQEQIAALKKAKQEADAANEAKSVFLSSMSHDLRTPLNGVLGFTSFAIKENDPQKKQEYLEKVEASGKLLLDLVNDTLELSRIESGKAVLEPEVVKSGDVIPAVAISLKPSAELKGITYNTNFDIELSNPIWCDKLKVQKIVLNLISNAIKFTPSGGTVSVSLKTLTDDDANLFYALVVEDTGMGMSREFMKHMYEPFSQEKRSESVRLPGTGLGLSIVKRYVDMMGGSIETSSELHKGTRFLVMIPVSSASQITERQQNNENDLHSLVGKHILLCEDNYMNTEIAVMLLKEQQMIVDTAENGKEGLEKFISSNPGYYNAVLMDIRMPVMDGYETTKKIRTLDRSDARTVPIIAMTADAFEESVHEADAAGMSAYVTKPIEPQKLYQTLVQSIQP